MRGCKRRQILGEDDDDDDEDKETEGCHHRHSDEKAGASPFSLLPPELVNTVLAWLPLRSLLRFRCVCKRWNSAFLSPRFTHFPSCLPSACQKPWLIFFEPKTYDFLAAFDFASRSWLKLPLSFPYNYSPLSNGGHRFIWCTGSARGRLLLDVGSSLYVCNPLTKALFALPPLKSIHLIVTQGFAPDHIRHGCKILVVGQAKAKSGLLIEAYQPESQSWDVVGSLPSSFVIKHDQMTECNDCFYILLMKPSGMLTITDAGKHWSLSALPSSSLAMNPRLVVCLNVVFMVGCPYGDQGFEKIFLWRFNPEAKDWQMLAVMPDIVADSVKEIALSNWIDCVGVGKLICFRALGGSKVLTYDVCDSTWEWLPDWPFSVPTVWTRGFQFEARVEALHCSQS